MQIDNLCETSLEKKQKKAEPNRLKIKKAGQRLQLTPPPSPIKKKISSLSLNVGSILAQLFLFRVRPMQENPVFCHSTVSCWYLTDVLPLTVIEVCNLTTVKQDISVLSFVVCSFVSTFYTEWQNAHFVGLIRYFYHSSLIHLFGTTRITVELLPI